MSRYVYDSLETIERRIRQVRADIGYVSVSEVVDRHHIEGIGRVDFTETDLAPYAFDPAPPVEFEEAGELGELGDAATLDDPALRLAEGVCRWIRETASQNMPGRAECRFRVFVWRPKGEQILFSARFGCMDPTFDPDAPVAPSVPASTALPASSFPAPTVAAAPAHPSLESLPEARVWGALGGGYTHLIELLQKSYAHLATLQNTTISNQNTQILRLQRVLEELMGEVVKMRVGVAEADTTRREDVDASRMREELGKQFISELGTFGRVFASAKFGMAPELMELAEIVNASPELLDAMKNPEVRKMLRDEKTRKELAELLMMAARSAAPPNASPQDQPAAA
ncbi:MAG: hypothetical protein Q8P41_30325 [Pseudomonadota bacterium]|nr:hypothetical protein [Pseudomonadota bacterium]